MDETNDQDRRRKPAQGVRIIGAEEAAAALRSGEATGRLPAADPPRRGSGRRGSRRSSAASAEGHERDPEPDPLEPQAGQIPEMPHWTDPPTGEVPAVLAGDPRGVPDEDLDAWSNLPGSRGVGWKDQSSDWEDAEYEPSQLADEDTRVGALADPDEAEGLSLDTVNEAGKPVPDARPDWGDGGGPTTVGAPPEDLIRIGAQSRESHDAEGERRRGRSIGAAVVSGVIFAVVALVLFKLGSVTSLLLAVVVVTLAAAELFAALRRAGYRPATLLGLAATPGIMIAAYLEGPAAIPLLMALAVIFTLLWYLAGVVRARPTVNVATTLLAFCWVGVLGSFAGLLLEPRAFPDRHGVALLLGAALVAVAYDLGGLVFGSLLGRHQLAPVISPNKTWEGLVGGMVTTFFVGLVVVSQIHPWTFSKAAALGLVAAVAAPLGDLCQSMIKRDAGIKDMGNTLPGHGGMLDRVDAMLFVLPAAYYLVQLVHLH